MSEASKLYSMYLLNLSNQWRFNVKTKHPPTMTIADHKKITANRKSLRAVIDK